MKKFFLSVFVLGLASVMAIGATTAYFSDTETSSDNTFTAGTLDLKLDGGDTDVVKFSLTNMRPGNQPKRTFTLYNAGSLPGTLSLSDVTITDTENARLEPEIEAGDTTVGVGELSSVINLRIFVDYGKDGGISTGDPVLFNDRAVNLTSPIELEDSLASMNDVNVVFLFDWWNTPEDNQAQGDTFTMDLAFTLEQ